MGNRSKNNQQYRGKARQKKLLRVLASVFLALLLASIISPTFGGVVKGDESSPEVTLAPTVAETTEATIPPTTTVPETTEATDPPETTVPTVVTTEPLVTTQTEPPATSPPVTEAVTRNDFSWCDQVDLEDNRSGYIGRLMIPSVGINVALREGTGLSTLQAYVDAQDSAAIFWDSSGRTVGDHNNQDFATLHEIEVGDRLRIYYPDGTYTEFEVTVKFKGHNTGNDLVDDDWNGFVNADPDGLILYTCYNGWQNIWIVVCKLV